MSDFLMRLPDEGAVAVCPGSLDWHAPHHVRRHPDALGGASQRLSPHGVS